MHSRICKKVGETILGQTRRTLTDRGFSEWLQLWLPWDVLLVLGNQEAWVLQRLGKGEQVSGLDEMGVDLRIFLLYPHPHNAGHPSAGEIVDQKKGPRRHGETRRKRLCLGLGSG